MYEQSISETVWCQAILHSKGPDIVRNRLPLAAYSQIELNLEQRSLFGKASWLPHEKKNNE